MKTFIKYFGLALVIQVWLLKVVGLVDPAAPGHSVFERYSIIYVPFMFVIDRLGHFHGCGGMFISVLYGVALGVLVYSIIAGAVGFCIRFWRHADR